MDKECASASNCVRVELFFLLLHSMNNLKEVSHRHVLGIDVLRFFAAALVMWFHFAYLLGANPEGMGAKVSKGLVSFPELYNTAYFGWVGVPIFFVISGFVIAFSGERSDAFGFFMSRVLRLGPGVWICASITLPVALATGLDGAIRGYLQSILFIPFAPWIDGSYWTLGIEIAFYASVLILIRYGHFMKIIPFSIGVGIASSIFWTIMVIADFVFPTDVPKFFVKLRHARILDLLLIHHGVFFATGILIWYQIFKKSSMQNIFWCVLFCVAGCFQIFEETRTINSSLRFSYNADIACFIFIVSVIGIYVSARFNYLFNFAPPVLIKTVRTAGLLTFPVYLLHQIVGSAMMGAMVELNINRWVAFATVIFVVIFIAWVVSVHLEPKLRAKTKIILLIIRERIVALNGAVRS